MESNYEPFNESGTMLPPSPEDVEYLTYEEQAAKVEEPEDEGYYEHLSGTPFPKYYLTRKKDGWIKSITRSEYGTLNRQQQTRHYHRVPMCGHKFIPGAAPRHRNCEACWFAFFNVHGELTQSIEELYAKHGATPVVRLLGKKLLHNWLKFMSTIATLKSAQEAKAQAAKDAFVLPSEEKDVSNSTVEQGSGESTLDALFGPGTTNAITGDDQFELFQKG